MAENRFFQIRFQNFGRKRKNIQTNSEAWILIQVQCVVYQWICLNELYQLMESLFQIQISTLLQLQPASSRQVQPRLADTIYRDIGFDTSVLAKVLKWPNWKAIENENC